MAIAAIAHDDHLRKEALILLALAIVSVLLRFLGRIQATGFRKLELDDWGMIVAVVSNESPDGPPVI